MAGAERSRSSPVSAPVASRMAQKVSFLQRSQRALTRSFSSGFSHFRAAESLGNTGIRAAARSHPCAAASARAVICAAASVNPGAYAFSTAASPRISSTAFSSSFAQWRALRSTRSSSARPNSVSPPSSGRDAQTAFCSSSQRSG